MTARSKSLQPGHRVSVRLPKGSSSSYVQDATITMVAGDSLTITTLAAPPPVVTPPPTTPPSSGVPAVIPGDLMTHDFRKDGMGPFQLLTYPNTHEGDTDPMLGWKAWRRPDLGRWLTQKFVTDAAHTSIDADGLVQRCTPPTAAGQPWLASFAGTLDMAGNPKFTKSFTPPILVQKAIAFELAGQDCEWPGAWDYRTWLFGDGELPDWPEIYGQRAHANLHVPGKAEFANIAIPKGWHVYGSLILPDQVAVFLDGVEIARRSWPVGTDPLGIFLDAKAGLAAPPASPKPFAMRTAWVSVKKVAA